MRGLAVMGLMRPWTIALSGAGCALLIDIVVVWPMLSSVAVLALAATTLYGALVLLLTSAVFVVGLYRMRKRLRQTPQTRDQWVALFAGTGLDRLADRILDLAPPDDRGHPQNLLLQSRIDPGQIRREVVFLFRDWLTRTHFFSALALLLAISGWSAFQEYARVSVIAAVFPIHLALAAVLVIAIVALLAQTAVNRATEPVLDAITGLSLVRIDTHLFRNLSDLAERASNARPETSSAPGPAIPFGPTLERFTVVLEDTLASLDRSTARLAANADLLEAAMRALTDREANAAAVPRAERAEELKIAVEELTAAIERLSKGERMPPAIEAEGQERAASTSQAVSDTTDLGREVRALLKEFS